MHLKLLLVDGSDCGSTVSNSVFSSFLAVRSSKLCAYNKIALDDTLEMCFRVLKFFFLLSSEQ
jgi:hypothetical protein